MQFFGHIRGIAIWLESDSGSPCGSNEPKTLHFHLVGHHLKRLGPNRPDCQISHCRSVLMVRHVQDMVICRKRSPHMYTSTTDSRMYYRFIFSVAPFRYCEQTPELSGGLVQIAGENYNTLSWSKEQSPTQVLGPIAGAACKNNGFTFNHF
jgi:hypothetical protein